MLEALEIMGADRAAEVVKASQGQYTHLTKAVRSWMSAWESRESSTEVLRASGMHGLCPREFVLNYWQPKPGPPVNWRSRLMMDTGTWLHWYLQNCVLGPMGVLHGKWLLKKTGDIVEGFHPDPLAVMWDIQSRREPRWQYIEPAYWDEHLRISGHGDGDVSVNRVQWLDEHSALVRKSPLQAIEELQEVPAGDLILLEIKTCGQYIFDRTESPADIADYYKMQACIYQRLAGVKHTLFWFLMRDSMSSKTLIYEHDEGWWRDARRKARIVWEAIRDETLPEAAMACKLPTDTRAKKCPFRDPCWNAKLDFAGYVAEGKRTQPDREWLDLKTWADEER